MSILRTVSNASLLNQKTLTYRQHGEKGKIMEYSPLSNSAAYAVSSNGINILKMPKFASKIAKTIIYMRASGWVEIYWVDKSDKIIYEKPCSLIREGDVDQYPMIGKVVKVEC